MLNAAAIVAVVVACVVALALGEKHVADVLNAAGLREGVSYSRQVVLADGRKPDFTIPLRDDLFLHLEQRADQARTILVWAIQESNL